MFKKIVSLLSLLFISTSLFAQTVIWSEDFEGPNTDWTLNQLTGAQGDSPNEFQINSQEHGGFNDGDCSAQSSGGNGNKTLSVYNPTWNSFIGLYGAHYYAGGLGDDCTTNKRAFYNQAISTIGQSNMDLNFVWLHGGEAGSDFGTLEYSVDGGTTWITLQSFGFSPSCGGTYEWQEENVALPAVCENIADLRFAFTWTNNNNATGVDPSMAIDEMEIVIAGAPTPLPTASFSASATNVCIGDPINFTDLSTGVNLNSWAWNFGNGATSTAQNPTNISYASAGDYTVTLTVTDDNGMDDTIQVDYITVVDCSDPVANFSASQTNLCIGDCIDFTDLSTGLNINSWSWDFGNGATSTNQNPTNICYNTAGNYTVSLSVTDDNGTDDTIRVDYIVVNDCSDPNASFSASQTNLCIGDCIDFTDESVGTNISAWSWNFGNGITSTDQDPTNICFNTAGSYTVSLTITDDNGMDDSVRVDYIIVNDCSNPSANFSVSQNNLCPNDCIDFTDLSTGMNISSWTWDFGNGATSTNQNPTGICYSTPGVYTVTLSIMDDNGVDDTIKVNHITVNPAPIIEANVLPSDTSCTDSTLVLFGSGGVSYSWDNGVTDAVPFVFLESTIYTVLGTDINGCQNSDEIFIFNACIEDVLLDIPNVFTPNSDMANDTWFVTHSGIETYNCTIYNRWGNLIYEYSDIDAGWDGKSSNGELVTDGVYYYMIKATTILGVELNKSGFIHKVGK